MTLQDFFDMLSQNPAIILFYFAAIPLTAFLAGVFGKGEGHLTPWKELYCFLSYATAIPAIFAITLNVYLFLFEKQPIMQTNIYTQLAVMWFLDRMRIIAFTYMPFHYIIIGLVVAFVLVRFGAKRLVSGEKVAE